MRLSKALQVCFLSATTIASAAHGGVGDTVGHWRFDEFVGGQVFDSSPNANDGAIIGAEWFVGVNGYALRFQVGDRVIVPHQDSQNVSTNQVTIEAWVKPSGSQAAGQFVPLVVKNQPGQRDGYSLFISEQNLVYAFFGDGATRSIVANTPLPVGRWTHVAAWFDGAENRIYLDRELDAARSNIDEVLPSLQDIEIGGSSNLSRGSFYGTLDEVRISSRALDPSEFILSDTVGHWRFDESVGDQVFDNSPNANDGTITGAERVAGVNGPALRFQVGDRVIVPHQDSQNVTTNQVTLEAWVKPSGSQAAGQFVPLVVKNEPGQRDGYSLFISEQNLVYAFFGDGATRSIVANTPLPVGQWTHVAAWFDGAENRIYLDRELDASRSNVDEILPSLQEVEIGGSSNPSRGSFYGTLDEVRISSRALDSSKFIPLATWLHIDNFESGDLSRWSGSVP